MCSLVPYTGLDWLEEERESAGHKSILADNRHTSPDIDLSDMGLATGQGPLAGETVNGVQ